VNAPFQRPREGVVKRKRKNRENLFCRHCGTTETPEWRRGPDGLKSYPFQLLLKLKEGNQKFDWNRLCNACGIYYGKMMKKETMNVPVQRKLSLDTLLNSEIAEPGKGTENLELLKKKQIEKESNPPKQEDDGDNNNKPITDEKAVENDMVLEKKAD
jgi:hypothetical protein